MRPNKAASRPSVPSSGLARGRPREPYPAPDRAPARGATGACAPLLAEALERLSAAMHRAALDAETLRSVLDDENDALRASDAEALEAVVQRKQALVAQLECSAKEQADVLMSLGYEFDGQGMDALLSEARHRVPRAIASQVERAWSRMRQLLEDCQAHNRRNQQTLAVQQRRVRAALEILRGEHGAPTYDARGRAPRPVANAAVPPLGRA